MPYVLYYITFYYVKKNTIYKAVFQRPFSFTSPLFCVSVSLFECSPCSWTQQSRGGRPMALYNGPVSWSRARAAVGRGQHWGTTLQRRKISRAGTTYMYQETGEHTKLRHPAYTIYWVNLGAHYTPSALGDRCPQSFTHSFPTSPRKPTHSS